MDFETNINNFQNFFVEIEEKEILNLYNSYEFSLNLKSEEKKNLEIFLLNENKDVKHFIISIQKQIQESPNIIGNYKLLFPNKIKITNDNFKDVLSLKKYKTPYCYIFYDYQNILTIKLKLLADVR